MKLKENKTAVAILHNIRSLHNVGSMFRSGDGAGISKFYLTGYTPAPIDRFGRPVREIAKTALGAELTVPWEKERNIKKVTARLKSEGFMIVAVEQSPRAVSHDTKILHPKVALVVGNEVRGISAAVLACADLVLEIPMRGAMVRQAHHPHHKGSGKESLNVSVAFGIAAYALLGD